MLEPVSVISDGRSGNNLSCAATNSPKSGVIDPYLYRGIPDPRQGPNSQSQGGEERGTRGEGILKNGGG